MRLKSQPEDFQVEEQIGRAPSRGRFALYRLEKRGLGTLEAVAAVGRRWQIPPRAFSYGGLKDRHAVTVQWVCIEDGPRRGLTQTNFDLHYIGQTDRPLESADITANRFQITLRDLSDADASRAAARLRAVERDGALNYFDRQRFGSLGASGEYIARPWCERNYERAVWLALADPRAGDRPDDHRGKEAVRQRWGEWQALAAEFRPGPQQAVLEHLARSGGNFRSAIACFPVAWRRLWIGAFESHLWNRALAALVRQACRPEQLRDATIGPDTLPLFRDLEENQRTTLGEVQLPYPSARNRSADSPWIPLLEETVAREGLSLRQLKIDYPRDSFFSKGSRPAVYRPAAAECETAADESAPQRTKLLLRFTLPPGSYATMLIRAIED